MANAAAFVVGVWVGAAAIFVAALIVRGGND